MKLTRLNIRRMPGFESGGPKLDELSPGLNVVVGPNGAGKTTICRAIRGLLSPKTLAQTPTADIVGGWQDKQGLLHLEAQGQAVTAQRDGIDADPPAPLSSHLAHSFTITVEDLMLGDPTDKELAGLIAREMRGGYDLAAVKSEDPFSIGSRHGQNKHKIWRNTRETLQAAQAKQSELRKQEESLTEKEREKEEAAEARKTVAALDRAKELADTRAKFKEAQQNLKDKFPPDMEKIQGDEVERLTDLDKDEQDTQKRLEEWQEAKGDAETALAESKLTEKVPAAGLGESKSRCEKAKDLDLQISQLHREAAKLQEKAGQAEKDLQIVDATKLAAIDLKSLDGAEADLLEITKQDEKRVSCENELELLKSQPRREQATARQPGRGLAWLGIGLAAALAVAMAVLFSVWILLLLVPIALIAFGLLSKRPDQALDDKINERKKADLQKEIESAASKSKAIRARLANTLGLDPSGGRISIQLFMQQLLAYRAAQKDLAETQAEIDEMQKQLDDLLAQINRFTAAYGFEPAADDVAAAAAWENLNNRNESFTQATDKLAQAKKEVKKAEEKLGELTEQKKRFYQKRGLTLDDEEGLQKRVKLYQDYKEAAAKRKTLKDGVEMLENGLAEHPEYLDLDGDETDQLRGQAEEKAASYDAVSEQITTIKNDIERAKKANALEEALAAVMAAADVVRVKREEALLGKAGAWLLDAVEKEHEQVSQPPVIRRAGELLETFTTGRYSIRFNAKQPASESFRAFDNEKRIGLKPGQLSHGTLTQLLLAVRLAYAQQKENEEKLPILLDEALSSSDPERFAAVAQSLLSLVRRGDRQVFYFTCQPVDARAWAQAAADADYAEGRVLDLGRSESVSLSSIDRFAPSAADRQPPPEPQGMSREEYAALIGAPAFDVRTQAGEIHLVHLVDDLELLHRMLSAGIESWGQWRRLSEVGAEYGEMATAAQADRIQAKAKLLDELAESWRVGRGRPLYREAVLAACGDSKLNKDVAAKARELGDDAKALLAALEGREVKGLHKKTIDEIREYLVDNDFLDERAVLAKEETWGMVERAIAPWIEKNVLSVAEARELFERHWP